MTRKATHVFIISTFVILYLLVSIISTIHVIDFFLLSNPKWLAISLAVAFEVGAAASLASIITLEKMNRWIVWGLFVLLTLMQAMGNTYYTYVHLINFQGWIELFGLVDEELIYQKRILSIVSGAILPIVALGFIKSLVDYIKPAQTETSPIIQAPSLRRDDPVNEPPYVSDDFQIGPNGAYEHDQETESTNIDQNSSAESGSTESTQETNEAAKVDNTKLIIKSSPIDEAIARGGKISFSDKL